MKIGDDLAAGKASIRETVVFTEQPEISIEEDKAEEYLRWTIEGIENIRQHFQTALKTWIALIAEQKKAGGKKSKKLLTIRRKTARLRLEIAQEIKDTPTALKDAPLTTPVGRLDETHAARHPVLRWGKE